MKLSWNAGSGDGSAVMWMSTTMNTTFSHLICTDGMRRLGACAPADTHQHSQDTITEETRRDMEIVDLVVIDDSSRVQDETGEQRFQ